MFESQTLPSKQRGLIAISITLLGLMLASGALSVSAYSSGVSSSAPASNQSSSFPSSGELDCNGYSSVQTAVDKDLSCAQPIGPNGIYTDNGWYVGHDEPGMRFISSAAGSGNSQVYNIKLPEGQTSDNGIRFFEDAAAPWFSMAICDPNSYPQQPCKPDSDSNTGTGKLPTDAGAAVLELQFYGPGFPPFYAADSCDLTHWCAALNIDSLECTFAFATCNANCEEPVNFAFLTLNGVPIGPPSPQKANLSTFDTVSKNGQLVSANNKDILLMNPGDVVQLIMHDTANGLYTEVNDLTSGTYGWMVASGANGFQNTNPKTCAGTPFDFHPEYSTARTNNLVPWTALQLGVMADVDGVGHFEIKDGDGSTNGTCNPLTCDDTYCLRALPSMDLGKVKVCLSADTDFDGFSYVKADWPHTIDATPHNSAPWTLLDVVPGVIGPSSGGKGYPTIELETDIGFTTVETGCNLEQPNQCGIPNQYPTDQIPTYAGFYPFFSVSGSSGAHECQAYFGDVSGSGIFTFGGIDGYGSTVAVGGGQSGPAVYGTNGAFYPNSCF
jgi:hypothetical protein